MVLSTAWQLANSKQGRKVIGLAAAAALKRLQKKKARAAAKKKRKKKSQITKGNR